MKTRYLSVFLVMFVFVTTNSFGMKSKNFAKKKRLFVSTCCGLEIYNKSSDKVDIQWAQKANNGQEEVFKKKLEISPESPKGFMFANIVNRSKGLQIILKNKNHFDPDNALQEKSTKVIDSLSFKLKRENRCDIIEGNSAIPFFLLRHKPNGEKEIVMPEPKKMGQTIS